MPQSQNEWRRWRLNETLPLLVKCDLIE